MVSKRKGLTVLGFIRGIGGQTGITLIELCMAILILAILVSIAVPVLLSCRKKADRVTAEYNLQIGASSLSRLYFKMLDEGPAPPDGVDSYRDFNPPEAMRSSSEFQSSGYVSVGAEYMSSYETKVKWADLQVAGGSSPPVASADVSSPLLATDPYGFEVIGVYVAGALKENGTQIAQDWSLLPGKVCVVENRYYWEGGWHENEKNMYVTLITLEHSGVAHYLTMKQGGIADYGYFDWKDGKGNPGEGWKDDNKPPDVGNTPADSSPAPGSDSSPAVSSPADTPPGDTTTPPNTEPTQPTEPTTQPTQPTEPTTQPTQPTEPTSSPQPTAVSSVRIEPETLNLKSNGVFTCFITLAEGYNAEDIDPTSLECFGAKAIRFTIEGNGTLQVKFDRKDLVDVPDGDAVEFVVKGKFKDGTPFQGSDFVRVTH